jgi:hypothetical protein
MSEAAGGDLVLQMEHVIQERIRKKQDEEAKKDPIKAELPIRCIACGVYRHRGVNEERHCLSKHLQRARADLQTAQARVRELEIKFGILCGSCGGRDGEHTAGDCPG